MVIKKVHCFFEQSGTFKNAFRSLGIDAEDYDILDDFGQTDNVIDLFAQIEKAYDGKPSIFDDIGPDDLIMAFFPCVRFEDQILISFRGQANQQQGWTDEQKLLYDLKLIDELHRLYQLVSKLLLICIRGGYRLIVENPYSDQHFLKRYWCIKPSLIDKDRRLNGDYYRKPTQYWFVGCQPENNFLFEALPVNELGVAIEFVNMKNTASTSAKNRTVARSMIHPDYADRFIRQFILDNNYDTP